MYLYTKSIAMTLCSVTAALAVACAGLYLLIRMRAETWVAAMQ